MKNFFSCLFVWTTFLSVGGQRSADRKEKNYFGENIFPLKVVFFKKFDWFDMIHQWVYTRMMIKFKKTLKKTWNKCFFEKEFWKTFLSVGVQNANAWKKNSFQSIFLVIEKYFQENRILNDSVKSIKGVTQE